MLIQFGGIYGGAGCPQRFAPLQRQLNKLCEKHFGTVCLENINYFYTVLRVSGKIHDFEGDGPGEPLYIKKELGLNIDLVIPQSKWRDKSDKEIKKTVSTGVRECLDLLIAKAEELGEIKNREGLREAIEKAMREFDETPIEAG